MEDIDMAIAISPDPEIQTYSRTGDPVVEPRRSRFKFQSSSSSKPTIDCGRTRVQKVYIRVSVLVLRIRSPMIPIGRSRDCE